MDKIIEMTEKVIKNVLVELYQPFFTALFIAFLLMIVLMYAKEHKITRTNFLNKIINKWLYEFKKSANFRKNFLLMFYSAMILLRTVLYREWWKYPLSNVMGGWGLYDADGNLTTEAIENLMLFIPFAVLLLWAFRKELLGDKPGLKKTMWVATKTVGIFSFVIEFSQLLFHLGTFQISDLVYNTLGGTVGGLAYYIIYKFRHRNG